MAGRDPAQAAVARARNPNSLRDIQVYKRALFVYKASEFTAVLLIGSTPSCRKMDECMVLRESRPRRMQRPRQMAALIREGLRMEYGPPRLLVLGHPVQWRLVIYNVHGRFS